MLNLISKVFLLVADYSFDPEMLDIVKDFFIVAGKYAIVFGLSAVLMKMLIRAGTGKERFL